MEKFDYLEGHEQEFIGKSLYMMIGQVQGNKLKYFDVTKPNFPKFKQDWQTLNYFFNFSDIIVQSSRNLNIETNLSVYPNRETIQEIGVELIEKKRALVIMTRTGNFNINHRVFQDGHRPYIVSLSEFECPYPVLINEVFSFDFISTISQRENMQNPTILCLYGGVLLDLLQQGGHNCDYLLFTELTSEKDDFPIAGEIDLNSFETRYSVIFTSKTYTTDAGEWRFRIFRLNKQ